MLKKLILLAACVALPFAGCGDTTEPDTKKKADSTATTDVSTSTPAATS